MIKLGAHDLRTKKPLKKDINKIKRNKIVIVLDEIFDTYNIGSIFRLADAISAEKIYLCGNMEYPPSSRIHKSAVGTEKWVPWEKTENTFDTVNKLKKDGYKIISVEQDKRSISYKNLNPDFPVAIVLGNESAGIKKEVLDISDIIVELPMLGVNKSFNVWGSGAVIAYKILEKLF